MIVLGIPRLAADENRWRIGENKRKQKKTKENKRK
jgi:hypothetical protein